MDKLLENHNLPRLNQEEIENIKRPITSTEIETVIKNLPPNQSPEQMASQANSIKLLQKSKHLSFSNSPKICQREEDFQTHSMRPPSS